MAELVDVRLGTRQFAYSLLSRGFIEHPNAELIEMMAGDGILEVFPYQEESIEISEGIRLLGDAVGECLKNPEEEVKELEYEYNRLFIGPGKLEAPPWESVYRSPKRLLFQEETIQVRKEYMKYGLLPGGLNQNPDDHIGLELDFMRILSERLLERWEQKDLVQLQDLLYSQRKFLEDHLLKWVPNFSSDIFKSTKSNFYLGLAKVLSGFVERDAKELAELLEEFKKH